jgi:hypothetical protein
MNKPNCIVAVKLEADPRGKSSRASDPYTLARLVGKVSKVGKQFAANGQTFRKGDDHCLACFFRRIGSRYLLDKAEYYCFLELFVLTPTAIQLETVVKQQSSTRG